MTKCDICSSATTWEEGKLYTSARFRILVQNGFTPPDDSVFFTLQARRGKSRQEALRLFKQAAMKSPTDWLLCPSCTNRAVQYDPM